MQNLEAVKIIADAFNEVAQDLYKTVDAYLEKIEAEAAAAAAAAEDAAEDIAAGKAEAAAAANAEYIDAMASNALGADDAKEGEAVKADTDDSAEVVKIDDFKERLAKAMQLLREVKK